MPCDSQWMDAVPMSLEQIDVVRRLVHQYPRYLSFATSAQGETLAPSVTEAPECQILTSIRILLPLNGYASHWIDKVVYKADLLIT